MAGRKRPAESHDQAPSAKAVRVDNGSGRTYFVPPAGTARIQTNEPSIRASAIQLHQYRNLISQIPTTHARHIRAKDDHDDEESEQEQEEEEEYWDEVLLYGPDFQIILSPTDSAVIA